MSCSLCSEVRRGKDLLEEDQETQRGQKGILLPQQDGSA